MSFLYRLNQLYTLSIVLCVGITPFFSALADPILAEEQCYIPGKKTPDIAVYVKNNPASFNHLLKGAVIQKNMLNDGDIEKGVSWQSRTLTQFSMNLVIDLIKAEGPPACFIIKTVEVHVGISKQEVFLPSDMDKNSCFFKASQRHENDQITLAKELVEEYVSYFDDHLRQWSKEPRVIQADTLGLAKIKAEQKVLLTLNPLMEEFSETHRIWQNRLNDKEYLDNLIEECNK